MLKGALLLYFIVLAQAANIFVPNYGSYSNPGYTCSDILSVNASATSGIYYVVGPSTSDSKHKAYCDMTNGGWTLIESFAFSENTPQSAPFGITYNTDSPVNQDSPAWTSYRLSKARMTNLAAKSSRIRATCNSDVSLKRDFFIVRTVNLPLFYVYVSNFNSIYFF
jgi:hypothetical protein